MLAGGDDGIRTHDPLLAGQVLSQLSYTPIIECRMQNAKCRIIRFCCFSVCELCSLVGPSGLEPPTSCLSGTRSNLLSYDPSWLVKWFFTWNGGDDGDSRAVRLRLLCSQLLFAIAPMRFRAVSEIGINFRWDLSRPFGTKFVPWWR